MKYVNDNKVEAPIAHFQGYCASGKPFIVDEFKGRAIALPENLEVVTMFTHYKDAILAQQLDANNIPYINKVPPEIEWDNTMKIEYILEALRDVKSDYVLILDANDVVISDSLGIALERFKTTNLEMLFNASSNNYPCSKVDHISDRHAKYGRFAYFNAGACIARTEYAINFYEDVAGLIASGTVDNPKKSEQLMVRHIFARRMDKVFFDWKREVFQTYGNTKLRKLENNIYEVV